MARIFTLLMLVLFLENLCVWGQSPLQVNKDIFTNKYNLPDISPLKLTSKQLGERVSSFYNDAYGKAFTFLGRSQNDNDKEHIQQSLPDFGERLNAGLPHIPPLNLENDRKYLSTDEDKKVQSSSGLLQSLEELLLLTKDHSSLKDSEEKSVSRISQLFSASRPDIYTSNQSTNYDNLSQNFDLLEKLLISSNAQSKSIISKPDTESRLSLSVSDSKQKTSNKETSINELLASSVEQQKDSKDASKILSSLLIPRSFSSSIPSVVNTLPDSMKSLCAIKGLSLSNQIDLMYSLISFLKNKSPNSTKLFLLLKELITNVKDNSDSSDSYNELLSSSKHSSEVTTLFTLIRVLEKLLDIKSQPEGLSKLASSTVTSEETSVLHGPQIYSASRLLASSPPNSPDSLSQKYFHKDLLEELLSSNINAEKSTQNYDSKFPLPLLMLPPLLSSSAATASSNYLTQNDLISKDSPMLTNSKPVNRARGNLELNSHLSLPISTSKFHTLSLIPSFDNISSQKRSSLDELLEVSHDKPQTMFLPTSPFIKSDHNSHKKESPLKELSTFLNKFPESIVKNPDRRSASNSLSQLLNSFPPNSNTNPNNNIFDLLQELPRYSTDSADVVKLVDNLGDSAAVPLLMPQPLLSNSNAFTDEKKISQDVYEYKPLFNNILTNFFPKNFGKFLYRSVFLPFVISRPLVSNFFSTLSNSSFVIEFLRKLQFLYNQITLKPTETDNDSSDFLSVPLSMFPSFSSDKSSRSFDNISYLGNLLSRLLHNLLSNYYSFENASSDIQNKNIFDEDSASISNRFSQGLTGNYIATKVFGRLKDSDDVQSTILNNMAELRTMIKEQSEVKDEVMNFYNHEIGQFYLIISNAIKYMEDNPLDGAKSAIIRTFDGSMSDYTHKKFKEKVEPALAVYSRILRKLEPLHDLRKKLNEETCLIGKAIIVAKFLLNHPDSPQFILAHYKVADALELFTNLRKNLDTSIETGAGRYVITHSDDVIELVDAIEEALVNIDFILTDKDSNNDENNDSDDINTADKMNIKIDVPNENEETT